MFLLWVVAERLLGFGEFTYFRIQHSILCNKVVVLRVVWEHNKIKTQGRQDSEKENDPEREREREYRGQVQ